MKVARAFVLLSVAVAASLLVYGCGEEDLTSVKFSVEADGSGKMVATLIRANAAGKDPIREATSGVVWKEQMLSVVVQEATFDDVSKVNVAGIKAQVTGNLFRLTVPLGESAKWADVLAPSKDEIETIKNLGEGQVVAIPAGVGAKFKFTVRLPGEIVAKGFTPKIAKEPSEGFLSFGPEETGGEASLVVPLRKVRESGEKELVWEVTWKK